MNKDGMVSGNGNGLYGLRFQDYPDVMSLEEMSRLLRVSTKTGRQLLASGAVPSLKIGRSYRIPKPYLISYLEKGSSSADF